MLSVCGHGGENYPPDLPEGYRVGHDPDTPALLREDGTVAAVFSAFGTTPCEIRRVARRDREARDAD